MRITKFIEKISVSLPSSVGAVCEMSLLRNSEQKPRGFYKHLAPAEPDLEFSELCAVFK